jgi:GR25 family glycosyltransferase involved in LPS biosynthesis
MKNLVSDIDIYCINLKDRIDRRLFMARQFKDLSVIKRSNFIEAVSATELTSEELINDLSKEESACLLSHIKAIKTFMASGSDFAIILEDDCDLSNSKKFNGSILNSIKLHNFKNFILQLGVSVRIEDSPMAKLKKRTFWDFSSMAYLIDREYGKRFLAKFKNINSINNYEIKKVLDPRNNKYFLTKNTAEEIVYSGNSYSIPILTSKILGSSLNHKNLSEALIQESSSIEKTNKLWDGKKNMDFNDYVKGADL